MLHNFNKDYLKLQFKTRVQTAFTASAIFPAKCVATPLQNNLLADRNV